MVVAAYIEEFFRALSRTSVKQYPTALGTLFDWLVGGRVLPFNRASSVREPQRVVETSKISAVSAEETGVLLVGIDASAMVDLRDRAFPGVLVYSFARVSPRFRSASPTTTPGEPLMPPTTAEFRTELREQIKRARQRGRPHAEINAGELHRTLGGYPPRAGEPAAAMPSCCEVMWEEYKRSPDYAQFSSGLRHDGPSASWERGLPARGKLAKATRGSCVIRKFLVACLTLAVSIGCASLDQPNTSLGPFPTDFKTTIRKHVLRSFFDPYSIRDASISEPVGSRTGEPDGWRLPETAKSGGYTGLPVPTGGGERMISVFDLGDR